MVVTLFVEDSLDVAAAVVVIVFVVVVVVVVVVDVFVVMVVINVVFLDVVVVINVVAVVFLPGCCTSNWSQRPDVDCFVGDSSKRRRLETGIRAGNVGVPS